MADEVADAPVQQGDPTLTVDQFAAKIKAKYPQYAQVDNATLTDKILAKYPQYSSQVNVPPAKMGNIPTATDLTQQLNIPYTPQYADAHQQAISVAKTQQQLPPQQPKPQKESDGILDKVSQAMYLPAFNQGFNELVTKPLSGGNDFVDRTIDKVYTGITGEQTPSWLRKGSGLDNIVKYYDDAYQNRDKPKNIVSDIAEGAVGTVPLMASLFTGSGEASLASKAPEFISKATKLLGVTGAANAYKNATDNGKDYGISALEAAKGELKGNVQGLTLDAQMLVGNAFGKGLVDELAARGVKMTGKAGDAVLHALATGTVFGSTAAGSDLLQGKDIDAHEAMKQFGMGLMFELPAVAKGLNEHLEGKNINDNAAKLATASTAISNMNAESTLRTLMNTPPDQLEQINSLPGTHDELYASSIEQGAKAYEAEDLGTKNNHYANQMLLKTQADVKLIADKVADPESRDALVQSITDSNELPPETKQDLLDKIAVLTPKTENDEKINKENANAQESISNQAPNESGQEVVPHEEGQVLNNEGGEQPPLHQVDIPNESEIPNVTQPSKVEENKISVNDVVGKPIKYHGEDAIIEQDGQALIAKIKDSNREYELGNADDIGDKSIKDLGIEHNESVVKPHENGNILVRGKEYVNNYSDPKSAINYDKDGNVVSVNLETKDGQKRAFKGDVAEDIAYQIHLKELNKNNETKQQFEQFIERHEPSKSAIVARENEIIAEKGADKNNATVSRKPAKSEITTKPQNYAFQEQKTGEKILQDIHKNSPELSKIGSKKEYEKHIENIFPKSTISRILYHGSDEPIENFKPSEKGIYFSEDPDYWPDKKHVYAAKVNIENPEYGNTSFIEKKPEGKDGIVWTKKDALEFFKDDVDTATPEGKEKLNRLKNLKDTYEAVVFDPKQIHVLGSEKDINEFKKYKNESIQKQKTGEVGVREPSAVGEGVGGQNKPKEPPQQSKESQPEEKEQEVKKTILTKRAYEGEISPEVKKNLEEKGLTRKSFSQEERSNQATDFIGKFGDQAAQKSIESGDVDGAMAASILAQLQIKNNRAMSELSPDSPEHEFLAKKNADLIELAERKGYLGGEFNGQLAYEYQNSELNYASMKRQVEKSTGKKLSNEQDAKIKKLSDANEDLKKQLADSESKLIEETDKAFKAGHEADKNESKAQKAKRIADKIRGGKLSRPGIFSSATPASVVWDGAVEVVAKSVEAGGKLADAIDEGIEHIKKSDWYKNLSNGKKKQAEGEFKSAHYETSGSTDLSDLQERFINKNDNKFTASQAKSIWTYMKENYINNGVSYRDALSKTADDLGLSWRQVSEAITTPKTKRISDEMWKKQYNYNRYRIAAKNWIGEQNNSRAGKFLKSVSGLFRGIAVFGHGGIFVGTHAGMNLFNPSTWRKVIPAFFNGWKFAYGSEANYQRGMEELKNSPNYVIAQRAGLKNDPDRINTEEYQKSQKYLGKLGQAGEKGFNAIKVLRQNIFDYHFNKLNSADRQDPEVAKSIAKIINLATGATNLKLPDWVNEVSFAGGMEASRWEKLTANPVKATRTAIKALVKPESATPAEKVFAKVWSRRVGEQLATYSTALIVNSAIQNMINPNNPVNITDPDKHDWLQFKLGDISIDPTSGMRGTAQFIYQIAKIPVEEQADLRGEDRVKLLSKKIGQHAKGKLAPFYSTLAEIYSSRDFAGNVVPWSDENPPKYAHNLSYGEYIWSKAPLPVAEAAEITYKSAIDNGGDPATVKDIIKGILSGGVSGTTGFRVEYNDDDE